MPSFNFMRFLDSRIDATLAEIEQERRAKTESAIVENSQRAFGDQGNRTGASGSYHGSGSVQGSSAGGSRASMGSSYTQGIGTYDNYLCKIEIRNNYLHIVKAHRYYGNLDKLVQDIDRDKKLLERAFSENSSLSLVRKLSISPRMRLRDLSESAEAVGNFPNFISHARTSIPARESITTFAY